MSESANIVTYLETTYGGDSGDSGESVPTEAGPVIGRDRE